MYTVFAEQFFIGLFERLCVVFGGRGSEFYLRLNEPIYCIYSIDRFQIVISK